MMQSRWFGGCILLLACIEIVHPICVLESDFGFKINCAFKKSGLFRVRNLGGLKAHASIGFSLGDELGFEQSLTNLDPSRRRSVSVKNGVPPNLVGDTRNNVKQEKRGKQNRIMMRPVAPPVIRPNQAAMDKLTTLHRRVSTMEPIVVSGPTVDTPTTLPRATPTVTMAKPMAMGVPAFRPLPPKEEHLKVVPITAKTHTPLQIPQSKGPGLVYQNPVPHQVNDIASYAYNTKKVDDYNTITGYSDDTVLKFNKDDINAKIVEIAKAGNISMEAVEAAIALRQQQLLNKYANLPAPATTTTTSTTKKPIVFELEPEPEIVVQTPQKPKRAQPTTGKVMNAPREYYPVGYEKNFDDQFQSKVELPDTSFHCGDQKYFPGLYGDESLGCMVFHVCALTDDGLVMKSFLCPESTLFDQTILKCNWWFYVDCKNTRKLYDTNIPVSKSYQLMKALTFFSSYKMEDGRPANPEDVVGVKEAISILQNQDNTKDNSPTSNIQVITPQPLIDERHKNIEINTEPSPIYRSNRNLNNNTNNNNNNPTNNNIRNNNDNIRNNAQRNVNLNTDSKSQENKLITVNAGFKINDTLEDTNASSSEREKKHRRRMTLRLSNSTKLTTEITPTESSTHKMSIIEMLKEEIQPIESVTVKQETLADQIESDQINPLNLPKNLPEIKRVYRSSAEKVHDDKEIAVVNNEKIQIVRPTPMAKLVGQFPTPVATIAKLDEAVLGNVRSKKHIVVVTPEKISLEKT